MHKKLPNYFIFIDHYDEEIFKNNNKNIGIIYRNYNSKRRENELIKIRKGCKKKKFQLYVSNDIRLAIKVKADGIYIPSFSKRKNYNNLENKNLKILGSAHNQKEIQEKILQKCIAIFLSPIFHVKKNKYFFDIYKFNLLAGTRNVSFFALGGINEKNIQKLKLLNIIGFGGISLFSKKNRPIKGRFFKNNLIL